MTKIDRRIAAPGQKTRWTERSEQARRALAHPDDSRTLPHNSAQIAKPKAARKLRLPAVRHG